MPVKRRKPKFRRSDYPGWMIEFLQFGQVSEVTEVNPLELLIWQHPGDADREQMRNVWLACRDDILRDWVKQRPGSRPTAWWQYDTHEQRKRLSGSGTARHEVLNMTPVFRFGIPDNWCTDMDARLWPHLNCTPIDPADPPVFESEATHLKRLALFQPRELKWLKETDFKPEVVIEEVTT